MHDAAGDDWRFDPTAGTVFGRGVSSAGQSYTRDRRPSRGPLPSVLAQAEQLPPGDEVQQRFTAVPPLDPRVTDVVAEVTAGATSPYERVRRIHAFLTDRAQRLPVQPRHRARDVRRRPGGLPAPPPRATASSTPAPWRSWCGPPVCRPGWRWATRRDQVQGDGSRLITSDDAHAWVEVYFQGLGLGALRPDAHLEDRRADMSWAPRADADHPPPTRRRSRPACRHRPGRRPGPTAPTAPSPRRSWVRTTTASLPQVLLVLGVALLAAAGRRCARGSRGCCSGAAGWPPGPPGALWDELTATALDAGRARCIRRGPRGRRHGSCRRSCGRPAGRRVPTGADAVRRLALAEEAASYGPARSRRASRPIPTSSAALRPDAPRLLAAASRRGPAPRPAVAGLPGDGGPVAGRGWRVPRLGGPRPCPRRRGHPHGLTATAGHARQPPSREGRRLSGGRAGEAAATGRSGGGSAPRGGSSAAAGRPGHRGRSDRGGRAAAAGRGGARSRRRRWLPCS